MRGKLRECAGWVYVGRRRRKKKKRRKKRGICFPCEKHLDKRHTLKRSKHTHHTVREIVGDLNGGASRIPCGHGERHIDGRRRGSALEGELQSVVTAKVPARLASTIELESGGVPRVTSELNCVAVVYG
jgi:hypothetical protein